MYLEYVKNAYRKTNNPILKGEEGQRNCKNGPQAYEKVFNVISHQTNAN